MKSAPLIFIAATLLVAGCGTVTPTLQPNEAYNTDSGVEVFALKKTTVPPYTVSQQQSTNAELVQVEIVNRGNSVYRISCVMFGGETQQGNITEADIDGELFLDNGLQESSIAPGGKVTGVIMLPFTGQPLTKLAWQTDETSIGTTDNIDTINLNAVPNGLNSVSSQKVSQTTSDTSVPNVSSRMRTYVKQTYGNVKFVVSNGSGTTTYSSNTDGSVLKEPSSMVDLTVSATLASSASVTDLKQIPTFDLPTVAKIAWGANVSPMVIGMSYYPPMNASETKAYTAWAVDYIHQLVQNIFSHDSQTILGTSFSSNIVNAVEGGLFVGNFEIELDNVASRGPYRVVIVNSTDNQTLDNQTVPTLSDVKNAITSTLNKSEPVQSN